MLLVDIFRYKFWADQRSVDPVKLIDVEKDPQLFSFARQQLNHMVRVEELFKSRLIGTAAPHHSTNTEWLPS